MNETQRHADAENAHPNTDLLRRNDISSTDRDKPQEDALSSKVASNFSFSDMPQLLQHMKNIEHDRSELQTKLKKMEESNKKLGQKTRQGMQSMLDTVIKHWLDSANTSADVREKTYKGLDNIVKAGDEENGVWQMMVAASSTHKQQHDKLENLLSENTKLKTQIDSFYGSSSSRTVESREVGSKSKAETELCREDVDEKDIWSDFTKMIEY